MRVRRPVGKRPGIQQPRPRPFQPGPSVDPSGPRPIGPRPVFDPRTINPVRPGMQQPRPGMFPSTIVNPIRQPGRINTFNSTPFPRQSQANTFNSTPPRPPQLFVDGIPATPNIGAMGNPISQPDIQQTLPTAPIGDPRLGAAIIPGNKMQEMMRGPQQAAPVQPVAAMKKGGVVRGGRAEIKGTRPAKLY